MSLHPMEEILVNALTEGRTITLNDLGGILAFKAHGKTLAESRFMDEFLSIILESSQGFSKKEKTILEKFISLCLKTATDGIVIQSAINCLEKYRPLTKKIEDRCFKVTLQEAQNRKKLPITRAWNLEGAFRFSVNAPERRFQLLAYLVALPVEDKTEYLRHAAKIIGLANTFWPDSALVSVLERLTTNEQGTDEAYFELGLATLANALDAESYDAAGKQFKQAREFFQKSIEEREERPDAEAFHAAISILLAFGQDNLKENYSNNLERLKKAVHIYNIWHESDVNWMSARKTEMVNWHTLAIKLDALAEYLNEPSWFEPTVVIEQSLLNIYTASRTILKRSRNGGLEAILQPTIKAKLIENSSQLYAFQKWLERQSSDNLGDIGRDLWREINNLKEETRPGKKEGTALDFKLAVPTDKLVGNVPHKEKQSVEKFFEDTCTMQKKNISPVLERILHTCISKLSDIKDYQDSNTSLMFNSILFQSLFFLKIRMDMTVRNNSRLKYLFNFGSNEALPKEEDLQIDYYEFMEGNIAAGDIRVEVSDISGGRVDVYFSFGAVRFIAEIKRELKDCSFASLRNKYIAQALEYQNTNVKLGFLLVLDLTEKNNGAGDIEDHIRVETIKSTNRSSDRAIVIIRVPGMRKVPSLVKSTNSK